MSRHHARLDRRRWARLRLRILDRDGWRCRSCGRAGRLEVDHVRPIDQGGDPYDPANLQTLCRRRCHFWKSRGEREQPSPGRDRWRRLIAAKLAAMR